MDQLTEQEWSRMCQHAYATNTPGGLVRLPPYGIILTLRTLVGTADDIVASHALVSLEPETVWKIWAFTARSIALVEARYQTDDYDLGEDEQRRQSNAFGSPAEPVSMIAWARPLSTVIAFEVAEVRYISRSRGFGRTTPDFYPTAIKIAFANGASTVVHVERSLDDESKRERWETFVAAARQGTT
ncbi:hypothetical protein A5667_27475 [Mycolicibacterium fortuitum]|uniref:hypothetical protein n=1 Tax=Mycolicibacterium fortuitum TaxID=1766 RepID=UPI0007ECCEF4|nr:hypothetical protein [Mycolicibacterium fortuitum]OBI65131.1 hypothetical protein A5667_27475 [Mycolicibacterium fortuitum]